ncbi:MAG: rhomboid family intramembrane serine protease, partial [Flavobacteriaceae bacterium]|nr:rhomboid family intramembrane serine protease [Flavobacteriaceae bacterium]
MNILNDIKVAYYKANTVEKVIYIQVALFIVSLISMSLVSSWFALNPDFTIFITKPWTILTYGFFHGSFIHLVFNLIFLFYIGNLFLSFFTVKQFLNYFLLGIISGGIAFLLIHPHGYLVGSSAGIMAVLVGLATKVPNYELRFNLIGSVKLWIIAGIYVLLSIFSLDGINSGGNIAHLGGALLGFIYTKQLEKGFDIGNYFEKAVNFFISLFESKKQNPLRTV